MLLDKNNNSNDPPIVRLGDALNYTTKWLMEAFKAVSDEFKKKLFYLSTSHIDEKLDPKMHDCKCVRD